MTGAEPVKEMSYAAPSEIVRQREAGWPDFHPEDFCHRCGRRNICWHVDSDLWNAVVDNRPDILCPTCFVADYERKTGERPAWRLSIAEAWKQSKSLRGRPPTEDPS